MIHVDIDLNLWHRYLHILLIFLRLEGYTIELRHRWRFIGDWSSNFLFRRVVPDRLVFRNPQPGTRLVLTNRTDVPGALVVDADYFPLPGDARQGFRVPMPMADTAYLIGVHAHAAEDPETPRQRGIFFFGNMDSGAYGREEALALFGCMNRLRILDTIRRELPHRVHAPQEESDIGVKEGRDIVLMDRARHYIQPARLQEELARFDFFLAPSGVVMPLCHNLPEAMLAGCIPILQYGHLLDPPLIDGVDCLRFIDERGLVEALDRVRRMSSEEVIRMRKAVLAYHRKNMTPTAVVARLESIREGKIHLNGEQASVDVLRRKLQKAGLTGLALR